MKKFYKKRRLKDRKQIVKMNFYINDNKNKNQSNNLNI